MCTLQNWFEFTLQVPLNVLFVLSLRKVQGCTLMLDISRRAVGMLKCPVMTSRWMMSDVVTCFLPWTCACDVCVLDYLIWNFLCSPGKLHK